MKRMIVLVTLGAALVCLAEESEFPFTKFMQKDISLADISYGVGMQAFFWKKGDDKFTGTSSMVEAGIGPLHINYTYINEGFEEIPFGNNIYHRLYGGAEISIWEINTILGGAVLFDSSFSYQAATPLIGVEFPFLKFLRTGDYTHTLSLRVESPPLLPLYIGGGLHFSRDYVPIYMALIVKPEFKDEDEYLDGWFDTTTVEVSIENISKMKLKNFRAELVLKDTSRAYNYEILPSESVILPKKGKTSVEVTVISLEKLSSRKEHCILVVTGEGKGGSKYREEFEMDLPLRAGAPPPIPEETPAGLI